MKVLGDINGDGKVTILDVLPALRHALNISQLSDDKLPLADVNGDGRITILDVLYIVRKALNIPNPSSTESTFFFTIEGNVLTLNMNTARLGTKKLAGFQLYMSGIDLENKTESGSGYLKENEKHAKLSNWIVACNKIADNKSILYFEMDAENAQLDSTLGAVELAKFPIASKQGTVQIVSDDVHESIAVNINDLDIIETLDFTV